MNESIKTYGTQDPVIETLSLTTSIDNTPSGPLIYTQTGTWREVMSLVPELGTRSEYFQNVEWKDAAGNDYRADLILKNISQTSTGGGASFKITLTYGAPDLIVENEDTQEPSYSMTTEEGTASILLHPRYKDISENERTIAKALLEGKSRKDLVNPCWAKNGNITLTDAQAGTGIPLEVVIKKIIPDGSRAEELIRKIESGIREYKTFGVVWQETTLKSGITNALTTLAAVSTPSGPNPSVEKRNWLYIGAEATKEKGAAKWKITRKWKLSDAEAKWDEDLY
ncbi:MAG: hypothetical protein IJX22_04345 [Opitutales bacterium]|nr:hypothetical protein [Opitutales bacterium]